MYNFNQSSKGGVWGNLENSIFQEVDVDDIKVSVFGGPIFQDDDRKYRSHKIPKEFFKVIIYEDNGELKFKGFLLSQNINRLEILDLDEFKTYEVSLIELEEKCHFKFDEILNDTQPKYQLEEFHVRKPISSLDQIKW